MEQRIEPLTAGNYKEVEAVWEASVRATHHFLKEEDIVAYKSTFPACLFAVQLFGVRNGDDLVGFIGLEGQKIQMLFIHPSSRGQGIGTALLQFAITDHGADQVDVNEQNEQARTFYDHAGFVPMGRSERDGLGKPYPLLHLTLSPEQG